METISGDTPENMHEVCFTILAIGKLQPETIFIRIFNYINYKMYSSRL